MLCQLNIKNVAVISEATVDFDDGLSVLTGETGAGKSLIIDSINLCLGERTPRDIIRHGEKKASVSAVFYVDEEGEKVTHTISREIFRDGRNICKIDGIHANVSQLREYAHTLINIHGQHDSSMLLKPQNHITYIDALGKTEEAHQKYLKAFNSYRKIKRQLKVMTSKLNERVDRIAILKHKIKEIDKIKPLPQEDRQLEERCKRLAVNENIYKLIEQVLELLYENRESVYPKLSEASDLLAEARDLDSELSPQSETLVNCVYMIEDVCRIISNYKSDIEFDEGQLKKSVARLDAITRLTHRYGDGDGGIESVLAVNNSMKQELAELEGADDKISVLKKQLQVAKNEMLTAAEQLTLLRQTAALSMQERVCRELHDLEMKKVRFEVSLTKGRYTDKGCDVVEFLISTSPSEPLKSMSKIASGGEMSRICLALKAVISDADSVNTLIFDEIDTGISGIAASMVAQKLRTLSRERQILCITHLPQLASIANHHFKVEKDTESDSFTAQLTELTHKGRIHELARLMGGINITPLSLKNAEEMLENAL